MIRSPLPVSSSARLFLFVATVLASGCASQAELIQWRRKMTIRPLPAEYGMAFSATVSVLQDEGFVIEEVDRRSGLIRALKQEYLTASSIRRAIGSLFSNDAPGSMDDGATYEVSCVLTRSSAVTTQIRAMIQREPPVPPPELEALAHITDAADDEDFRLYRENIYVPAVYQRLFDAIALEVERRKQPDKIPPGAGKEA